MVKATGLLANQVFLGIIESWTQDFDSELIGAWSPLRVILLLLLAVYIVEELLYYSPSLKKNILGE
jgi:hypothetical protein